MTKVSTVSYWLETSAEEIFGNPDSGKWIAEQPESKTEGRLLDFIEAKRESLRKGEEKVLKILSKKLFCAAS